MKLKELKKGDKLEVQYGFQNCNATVIDNFPDIHKIRVKIFLINKWIEDTFEYSSYMFDRYNFKTI
jgi:hypothetical protein